jgi:hypothetical protein
MEKLIKKLKQIIASEKSSPLDQLGTNILYVTVLGNEEEQNIYENDPLITEIGNLASDLEIKNGDDKYMKKSWERIKEIINALDEGKYIEPGVETIASKFEEQ